jgi:hypothetical protein
MIRAARHALEVATAAARIRDNLLARRYGPAAYLYAAAAYILPFGDNHTTDFQSSIHLQNAVCVLEDDAIRAPDINTEEYNLTNESMQTYRKDIDHVAGIEAILLQIQWLLGITSRPRVIMYVRSEPGAPAQDNHIDGRGTNINVMVYLTEGHRATELLINGKPLCTPNDYTSAGSVFFFLSDMVHRGPRNDSETYRLALFMSFGCHDTSGPPIFIK